MEGAWQRHAGPAPSTWTPAPGASLAGVRRDQSPTLQGQFLLLPPTLCSRSTQLRQPRPSVRERVPVHEPMLGRWNPALWPLLANAAPHLALRGRRGAILRGLRAGHKGAGAPGPQQRGGHGATRAGCLRGGEGLVHSQSHRCCRGGRARGARLCAERSSRPAVLRLVWTVHFRRRHKAQDPRACPAPHSLPRATPERPINRPSIQEHHSRSQSRDPPLRAPGCSPWRPSGLAAQS